MFGKIKDKLCENKTFARFAYVTFPQKRKKAGAFFKKHRRKIIVPAAACAVGAVVLLTATQKNTENSDLYVTGDDSANFGMVLQNYSTFDHSEKTHIAVALSWDDGAINLEDGIARGRIKAKVFPINLENPEIEWSTSDETIATIDEKGKIEATAPGHVDIKARLVNYDRGATAKLVVRRPVTGIILPTSTMTIYKGGSARYLSVRIFPADATEQGVKWESADNKVARVDSNGIVRPVGVGMTEIKAVTEDGGFEGRCFVTVVNPSVDVSEITLQNQNDMNMKVGDSINAIMTVAPSNAKNKTLKWSSDNTAVATVNQSGHIRAVAEGDANITAESVNGVRNTFTVAVSATDQPDPFNLAGDDDDVRVPAFAEPGTVTYTSYDMTLPQAVRIQMQMNQDPPLKIWSGGGHITASEAEVAEYLNPSSFYEDAYKFQFLDLSRPSGVSAESLNSFLADKGIMRGMGQAFIDASVQYGVNEVYLVAHACLETGNGTSQLSNGVEVNGVTVYNLFGIAAYDNSALSSGSQKAYREGWTSVESAIKGGAKWISKYYINSEDGRQNTLYKMLWNPETPGEHEYATDIGWAIKQAVNMEKIFQYLPDATFSYDIPVYSGMIPPTLTTEE